MIDGNNKQIITIDVMQHFEGQSRWEKENEEWEDSRGKSTFE